MKRSMKAFRLGVIALLGLSTLTPCRCLDDNSITSIADDDDIVQKNPDYVGASDVSDGEYDEEESDEEDVGGVEEKQLTKSALAQALERSRKQSKQTIKFVKKHRTAITLCVAAFAFRKELKMAIHHLATKQVIDPKTGQKSFQLRNVNPTAVLKLIIFAEVMRRSPLTGDNEDGDSASNAMMMLGRTNPLLKVILVKIFGKQSYNPAYIPPIRQHFTFERVNERYVKDAMALQKAINSKQTELKWPSSGSSSSRLGGNPDKVKLPDTGSNETVIVMDLTNVDSTVSIMDSLRDQVSFLLSQYRSAAMNVAAKNENKSADDVDNDSLLEPAEMEVVVILESPGGSAADFGLAAQQLLRLRNEPSVKLTICVDKVAASGGYMLACTASPGRLFAAPFSVLGSIGVIGQNININKVLQGWGVQPLVFRGGKDKAPLGLIGEITKEGQAKVQEMVDDTHRSFKRHVVESRPVLADRIHEVGTGDVWLGYDALELGLIDKIMTSDEYLSEKVSEGARVLKLVRYYRKSLFGGRDISPYSSYHPQSSLLHSLVQTVQNCMCGLANTFGFNVNHLIVGERQDVPLMENSEGFPSLRFPPTPVSGSTKKPML